MADVQHWKVRVKDEQTKGVNYRGKIYKPGDEFVMAKNLDKIPKFLEPLEEMQLNEKAQVVVDMKPAEKKVEDPTPPSDKTVVATPEGTEVVSTFEGGGVPSPAALKQLVKETESSTPKVVEDPNIGAPALAKFVVQEKGGGWYQVVNTDTNEVVSDKSMRQADAQAFADQLIEAAASAAE